MMKTRLTKVCTIFLLASSFPTAFSGCFEAQVPWDGVTTRSTSSNVPLKIATTTGMVTDIVQHVVGKHGEVTGIIGSGVDPHLFKATRHDIKVLQEAEVVFYSGLKLEGRMQDTLEQVNRKNRPVIAVTQRLAPEYLRSPSELQGHYDPHVWMDVSAWCQCVECVAETLTKFDPDHADEYRQKAKKYQSELTELDEYVNEVIESIPPPQRVLVTAHDAFGYFGRRYGIEVRSVQGVTTEAEAGVRDVNRLVDFLVQKKLPAIFVESSVSEKNIQAVIEGANSHNVKVSIGGNLFSDAMGVPGTYEGTYVGMLDHNATQIARALGGNPPEKGFRGRQTSKTEVSP